MNSAQRQAANEEAVRSFFSAWDPAWRWILVLGLRQMRSNPVALGQLAATEANGQQSWAEDSYAYGPLCQGITAAAVNEVALHCEDLFALLRCLRDPEYFARNIGNYKAGQVTAFGRRLVSSDDDTISRLFLVPDSETVREGLAMAEDPASDIEAVETGRQRLGTLVRETANYYVEHEELHLAYKHGLRLRMQPFGPLPDETIQDRRDSLKISLFSYTTDPLEAALRGGPEQPALMFTAGENQREHVHELMDERNILRLQLAHEVDLDGLVERSHTVMQLLEIAQANRLSLGDVEDGIQTFQMPGAQQWERVTVRLGLQQTLALADFAD